MLYNSSAPVGQRFSILGNTIVARMYHSEATLLPDGRVLISGSDPNPTGVQTYPEEFRIEVDSFSKHACSYRLIVAVDTRYTFRRTSPKGLSSPSSVSAPPTGHTADAIRSPD